MQRQSKVVDGTGGAGEVEDVVNPPGHVDEPRHVQIAELKGLVAEMFDVLERARGEVVKTDYVVALSEQAFTEIRTQEPGASRHDGAGHQRSAAVTDRLACSPSWPRVAFLAFLSSSILRPTSSSYHAISRQNT